MTYRFTIDKDDSFVDNMRRLRAEPWSKHFKLLDLEDAVRVYLFRTASPSKRFDVAFHRLQPIFSLDLREDTHGKEARRLMDQVINDMASRNLGAMAPTCKPKHEKAMSSILDKAKATVDSSRQGEYGDPVENWVATALIATITQRKPITPEDVIQVMTAQKSVRAGRSHKEDTNIDQAGYAEIRERVQKAFRDGTVQKIVEKLLGGWVKFGEPKKPSNATLMNVERRGYETHITLRLDGNVQLSYSGDKYRVDKA